MIKLPKKMHKSEETILKDMGIHFLFMILAEKGTLKIPAATIIPNIDPTPKTRR
jgi:hypothetical protein